MAGMRYPFKELPASSSSIARPVLPVVVEGQRRAPQYCLVDSGSLHNRFGAWLARSVGIDLGGTPTEVIALGGFQTEARRALVRLSVGDATWLSPVWFCNPWPLGFHILGQEGFLRHFEVTIRAASHEMELTPETPGS